MNVQGSSSLPALYLGHGAPPLLDDPVWTDELARWAGRLPRPKAILIVSAHWETVPLAVSSPEAGTPLVYHFFGFPERFYRMTYATPAAHELAGLLRRVLPDSQQPQEHWRGLDHGAWVPLKVMYPKADIPVLQLSIPTADPDRLVELGARLRPLRDHGVLIIGSGFLTHGLPFLRREDWAGTAPPPSWSQDFDLWAADALGRGDLVELTRYRTAPGMPFAHPTPEHLLPLFVTLGAATNPEAAPDTEIEGFFLGLSKRSFAMA